MLAKLSALAGWRRALLLFVTGAVLGWFHAPYNFWWLGFIGFPLFLLLLAPLQGRAAWLAGWLFGFGYFLTGVYWVSFAMLVDIGRFWWAVPLSMLGLPMYLACYPACAALVIQRLSTPGLSRVLVFAAVWSGAEWLRGYLFTGFPWLLWGYIWSDVTPVRLLAALGSSYLLSLFALLVAALPAAPLMDRHCRWPALALLAGLFAAAAGWSTYWSSRPEAGSDTLTLRLVQPDIAQTLKLDPAARADNLRKVLALTTAPGRADVVIWPETALEYWLDEESGLRALISRALPPGSILLTGVTRRDTDPQGRLRLYNSLMAMDAQGNILGSYDKAHLVPFGEYIPLRRWLPFDPIAGGLEFTPGPGPRSLRIGHLPPFSTMICYEVVFPGAVADPADPPDWLLNITNDAWYGDTNGPRQHWQVSRMRAVEQGVTLVRMANNGISGVIDRLGRVETEIPLGIAAVQDVTVTLSRLPTPFAIYGSRVYMLMLSVFLVTGIAARSVNHR